MKEFLRIDRVRARSLLAAAGTISWSLRNVLLALLTSIVLCGVLLSLVEPLNLAEGIYLSLITATTIGYGDLSPESWPGRALAVYAGVNGLVLTGVVVSIVVKSLEVTFARDLEELSNEGEDPEDRSH